eukprot:8613-Heterococcus_DN1.PRE.4
MLHVSAPSPCRLPFASISDWLLETSVSCELLHPQSLPASSVEVPWLQMFLTMAFHLDPEDADAVVYLSPPAEH